MKSALRDLFAGILASLARGVLKKYQPKVVMVTGSVGKTSTKDALAATLKHRFFVRASEKSYNSEFGVPLTVIGAANPWTRPDAWIKVFIEGIVLIIFPNHYPKVLVLEVGADSPGDLARILKIATPDAVVVTRLPDVPVHVEAYASPSAVRDEEFSPAYALAPGAPLIISADDPYARELAAPLTAHVYTYGFSDGADVRILSEGPLMDEGRVVGIEGVFSINGKDQRVTVPGALGHPQLLAPAAAIATALAFGLSVAEAAKGAETYEPPAGRGRLIRGMNGSVLLDDSYNASPAAVREGLASLATLATLQKGGRRIAALGDMLELGRYSQQEHEAIGKEAASSCDMLIAVGSRSRAMCDAAIAAGLDEAMTHHFNTSHDAGVYLKEVVQEGDMVLIKGSQSMRMERIAEMLLQDQHDRKLLVRQDREWKKR